MKTNSIKCTNIAEASRVLAKIHSQPEIVSAIAQGRMARWAHLNDLIQDEAGAYYVQWDGPHLRDQELKDRVELTEEVGELEPPDFDEQGTRTKDVVFVKTTRPVVRP